MLPGRDWFKNRGAKTVPPFTLVNDALITAEQGYPLPLLPSFGKNAGFGPLWQSQRLGHRVGERNNGSVFPSLNPDKEVPIGCALLAVRFKEGVARIEELLIAEDSITITAEGSLDLVADEYDLVFTPTTTDPGLVSMAPHVEIRGSMTDPEVNAVKTTLATSLVGGFLKGLGRLGRSLIPGLQSREDAIARGNRACQRLAESSR